MATVDELYNNYRAARSDLVRDLELLELLDTPKATWRDGSPIRNSLAGKGRLHEFAHAMKKKSAERYEAAVRALLPHQDQPAASPDQSNGREPAERQDVLLPEA